ncbi:hypothetical protein CIRG_06220 [Coccidioides immitis RMSCC 2394]|uniref:Protein kinase domain-containing protein n=1 Tax=Coccidioides immitis RMSCC 2394 TaxID=404692 RepID=A0A0J6YHK1_COCIT|nr:hypothetical protein CIRG_06220 [Coccidioides immitis RMSCC 2394]
MAISIADTSGPFLDPILPMPNLKKSAPIKQSFLHRLGLRKWLAKESKGPQNTPAPRPPSPVPPPLPLPLAAPPPPIEPRRPVKRPDHESSDIKDNSDDKYGIAPPQRRSVNNVNLSFAAEGDLETQKAERRELLTPSEKTEKSHRRAISADYRRPLSSVRTRSSRALSAPRSSAPDFSWDDNSYLTTRASFRNCSPILDNCDTPTYADTASGYGEDFEHVLQLELDKKWILNLSLRFRDRSDREKFFITYAEAPNRWRRVTVTCDYRDAEPDSLEQDLKELRFHRDKNARIYEAIRDSIDEIEFYDTVTNLKLQTHEGRLHVHVTEDINEVIPYPPISSIAHLSPPLIPESHIAFHSHLSGFVYHVKLNGENYVKKEITGPDTVEEFLYEINALHALLDSDCVIKFKGILVDDSVTVVKGLLLDFASQGSLADLFFDYKGKIEWIRRERWARQIIKGLADIHEAGFVQGDFTVSNVVVDTNDDAKIIDINRRGCPIGWEPPEFTKKIESKQRISMYIGVKSDLFQLGMTLWAMAMEEDEPGAQPRPLNIPGDLKIPDYFRNIVHICLNPRPQNRLSAKELLTLFPQDLPNHALEKFLEYPEQDSGNFITTQRCDVADSDVCHHNHQPDGFWEQPADSIHIHSLPNSNRSLDSDVHSNVALHLTTTRRTSANSTQYDTTRLQDEVLDDHVLPFPVGDLYCPDEASLSVEPTDNHPNLEDFTQCELDPNNSRNPFSCQSVLNTGVFPIQQETQFDSLEPGSQATCPKIIVSETKELPEVLTGVGGHIPYSFENPFILSNGKSKARRVYSDPDLLSKTYPAGATSSSEEATADSGDLSSAACHKPTPQVLYASDFNNLLLSKLPINPAFTAYSTAKADLGLSAHRLATRISFVDKDSISAMQLDTPSIPSDDLFTSNLPINPCIDDIRRYSKRYSSSHDSLLTSQLPISPAFRASLLQQARSSNNDQVLNIPSSLCINELSSSDALPANDLFTSNLPLNPAYTSGS